MQKQENGNAKEKSYTNKNQQKGNMLWNALNTALINNYKTNFAINQILL